MDEGIYYELQNENARLREEIKELREKYESGEKSIEKSLFTDGELVYYPRVGCFWDGKPNVYPEAAIFCGELTTGKAVLQLLSGGIHLPYNLSTPATLLSRSMEEFDQKKKAGDFDKWAESLI